MMREPRLNYHLSDLCVEVLLEKKKKKERKGTLRFLYRMYIDRFHVRLVRLNFGVWVKSSVTWARFNVL